MKSLNRQDRPPMPGPSVEIFRVTPEAPFLAIILSEKIWGCWTHWDGRRTRECTAGGGANPCDHGESDPSHTVQTGAPDDGLPLYSKCVGHREQWPLRWKGYLDVYATTRQKRGFFELTPGAAQTLIHLAGSNESLRGFQLRAGRSGRTSNCRIWLELTAGTQTAIELPSPKDPEPALRVLWGWMK